MKYKWHPLTAAALSSAAFCSALLGCSTMRQSEKKDPSRAVKIELKTKPGASFDTSYHSHAYIRNYSGSQLTREKHESVDFITRTKADNSPPGLLRYSVRTIGKDGAVDLHELAFPEKNEEIEFVVRPDAVVLKAGPYAPDSLFFVPALPVPHEPVEVGDTWTMTHEWNSAREKIPLRLETVGVLKSLVSCEGNKKCAELEISGGVRLAVPPNAEGAMFRSRIWGRMLFSLDRGDVIWSEVRSEEEMGTKGERVLIQSCMASETKIGKEYKSKIDCDPGEKPAAPAPKM